MTKIQRGFTLIELIVFIVVGGIIFTGIITGIMEMLIRVSSPNAIIQAIFLANARTEIILQSRLSNGSTSLSDPCATSLNVCTPLSSYATANGFTVSTAITGTTTKTITVQVSGNGNATIVTQVANYDQR